MIGHRRTAGYRIAGATWNRRPGYSPPVIEDDSKPPYIGYRSRAEAIHADDDEIVMALITAFLGIDKCH